MDGFTEYNAKSEKHNINRIYEQNIMLSQSDKHKYHMASLILRILKTKQMSEDK